LKGVRGLAAVLPGVLVLFAAGCGGGTNTQPIPTPAITNLFPSNVTAGSQSFTMSISGSSFISDSRGTTFAYWNGAARSTTLNVDTGQLAVTILASDVAVPGIAQVSVANPSPGGESIVAATFTIEPAQAGASAISSFSPASVNAGQPAFTLNVNGSNFAAGDVAVWNGTQRPATFLNQSQISIAVAQADIATASLASVAISQPGLIVASPSVNFPIVGPNSPTPSISSVTPNTTSTGSSDFQLVVKGSNFASNAVVEWNNMALATSFSNSGQLVALVPAADVAAQGTANVAVTNPNTAATPGGGTSSTVSLSIK
jgi:hypothetical protein